MANTGFPSFVLYAIVLALICFFVAEVSSVSLEERVRDKRMSELFGKRDRFLDKKRYFGAFRSAPSAIIMDPYDDAGVNGGVNGYYRNAWSKRMSEMFGKRQTMDGHFMPQWYGK